MTELTARERLVAAHLFRALEALLVPMVEAPATTEAPKRRRHRRTKAEIEAAQTPRRRGRPPKVRIVGRGVSGGLTADDLG